jgi:hypothetical protein
MACRPDDASRPIARPDGSHVLQCRTNRRSGADARNLHRCTSGGRAACLHGNRSPCRVMPSAPSCCCRPARGEPTVLVARTGRDLPCARAVAPLCAAATRTPAHRLLRGRLPESSQVQAVPGSRAAALRAKEQATVFSYRFGTRRSTALRQATSVKIRAASPGDKGLLSSRLRRALAVAQAVSLVVTAHTRCRRAVLPASALQSAACAPGMFKRCAA